MCRTPVVRPWQVAARQLPAWELRAVWSERIVMPHPVRYRHTVASTIIELLLPVVLYGLSRYTRRFVG